MIDLINRKYKQTLWCNIVFICALSDFKLHKVMYLKGGLLLKKHIHMNLIDTK